MRDYFHVVDLALAHVAAVEKVRLLDPVEIINIGTGNGLSVLEIVQEFERISGVSLNLRMAPRRPGDVSALWADVTKASRKLGFQSNHGIAEMCRDTWNWQSRNKFGYE